MFWYPQKNVISLSGVHGSAPISPLSHVLSSVSKWSSTRFFFQLFLFSFNPLNGCQYKLWFPWFLVKSNAILDLQCIIESSVTNVSAEFPVNYIFWSNNKLHSMPGPLFCMYVCMWACECVLCVLDKKVFLMFNANCSWVTPLPLLHMSFHFWVQITEGEAPIWDCHLHDIQKRERLGRTTKWLPKPRLGWRSFISACQSKSHGSTLHQLGMDFHSSSRSYSQRHHKEPAMYYYFTGRYIFGRIYLLE